MEIDMFETHSGPGWLVDLGQFGAWILTSAGAVVDTLYAVSATQVIFQALKITEYSAYRHRGGIGIDLQFGFTLTALDSLLLLVLACASVAAVIAIEYYFRKGRLKGLLLKRIVKVLGIEAAIIAAAILIQVVL